MTFFSSVPKGGAAAFVIALQREAEEMRLVLHLLRVSVFLYSKQNKGRVRSEPELFTVISQMKS